MRRIVMGKGVSYRDVEKHVHKRTRIDVSGRTIRRYGHDDFNITDKRTTRRLTIEGENSISHPPSQLFILTYAKYCECAHRNG